MFEDAEIIHSYSRSQAIEDGVLVDVSEIAREAGIKFPTAVTYSVWAKYVEVPEGLEGVQDEQGRLWDIVWMLRCAIGRASNPGPEIRYQLHVVKTKRDLDRTPPLVTLKALCGPGDNAEPVITIMLPDED